MDRDIVFFEWKKEQVTPTGFFSAEISDVEQDEVALSIVRPGKPSINGWVKLSYLKLLIEDMIRKEDKVISAE